MKNRVCVTSEAREEAATGGWVGAGRDYESEESEESESVVVGTLAQLARAWQELRVPERLSLG